MMPLVDSRKLWIIVGSLIIAIGSSIAGIMSFRNRSSVVMIGFLVFVLGYWTSQLGVHDTSNIRIEQVRQGFTRQNVLRLLFALIGLGGIAWGVTLFSQTVLDPNVATAMMSGVSSIGGYMFAHVGINRNGVGESIFKPIFDHLSGTG